MKDRSIAEALKEIDDAVWTKEKAEIDDYLQLIVHDRYGEIVSVTLELRRFHCDRGHIMMKVFGIFDIDDSDNFPRYFFTFKEADHHTRTFLKWRLYKHRVYPHTLEIE